MSSSVGAYLFLLGLSSGLCLLVLTAFRSVSPAWLRRLLSALGLLVMSRYLTMTLFTAEDAPQRFWALRHLWFASSAGLTLPSVFALDHLVRHPAMTPKKLLRWCSPFLAFYGAVIVFGSMTLDRDAIPAWTVSLSPGWQHALSVVQGLFVVGFVTMSVTLMRKIPSRRVRIALLGLLAAHVYLAVDGVVLAFGGWYFRPFLYSEMVALLAIWYAFETGSALHRTGG